MNELIELWNSYPILVQFSTWFIEMSLLNLAVFVFIVISYFSVELKTTIDGVVNNRPKHVITLVIITLMFAYPTTLWVAALPYGILILSLIFWNKPVFIYLNLFMPKEHKLRIP